MQEQAAAWIAFGASSIVFLVYEAWVLWGGRRHPERMARYAHARMRVSWAEALSEQPGFDISELRSVCTAASTSSCCVMKAVPRAATRRPSPEPGVAQ